MNTTSEFGPANADPTTGIPTDTAFSIMFVTIGLSCFMWQSITSGWMFYKARKPIIGLVFAQATLGIVVTFVTLLTSLVHVDCTFRLVFSVVGVNIADMSLQFVLLWKAYLGNSRSKAILVIGCIPIIAIGIFIIVNMTFGKSETALGVGVCYTKYPTFIVISKAIIDCTSNTFLSGCFILVIYRHYRILGSSIQRTLITEGLIYCFGVCFSNILTGILLTKEVLGGNTPILYTIDWYLASYLIIKQLRHRRKEGSLNSKEEDEEDGDSVDYSVESAPSMSSVVHGYGDKRPFQAEKNNLPINHGKQHDIYYSLPRDHGKQRDTYYSSIDGTLVPSPRSPTAHSFFENEMKYPLPSLPPFEKKIHVAVMDSNQKQHVTDLSIITTFGDERADLFNKTATSNKEK